MFMDMAGGDVDNQDSGPPALEQQPSQASEELEVMQTVGESSGATDADGEAGQEVGNNFDDFLNAEEPN
jgi:hypothetical protein